MSNHEKKYSKAAAELAAFGEELDKKKIIDYEEDEKDNVCKICGREFDSQSKKEEHMKDHF